MKRILLMLSLFALTPYVHAGVILSPIAAFASSEFSGDFDIGNTIDQSGLSSGFVSGTTDFDAYLSTNPLHTILAANNEWFTAPNVLSATIDYDLGAIFNIDRLAFWNEEFSGVGAISVAVSTDNAIFNTVVSGLSPTNWAAGQDYLADVFGLNGTHAAQYVRLTVSDCPQPNAQGPFCGFGEAAFSAAAATAVPEPSVILLLGSGFLGLWFARRRTQLQ